MYGGEAVAERSGGAVLAANEGNLHDAAIKWLGFITLFETKDACKVNA